MFVQLLRSINGWEASSLSFGWGYYGRMASAQKDEAIGRFVPDPNPRFDNCILGVDIPNATVMLIENTERFGLSQCISYEVALVVEHCSPTVCSEQFKTGTARQRLKVLEQSVSFSLRRWIMLSRS